MTAQALFTIRELVTSAPTDMVNALVDGSPRSSPSTKKYFPSSSLLHPALRFSLQGAPGSEHANMNAFHACSADFHRTSPFPWTICTHCFAGGRSASRDLPQRNPSPGGPSSSGPRSGDIHRSRGGGGVGRATSVPRRRAAVHNTGEGEAPSRPIALV